MRLASIRTSEVTQGCQAQTKSSLLGDASNMLYNLQLIPNIHLDFCADDTGTLVLTPFTRASDARNGGNSDAALAQPFHNKLTTTLTVRRNNAT